MDITLINSKPTITTAASALGAMNTGGFNDFRSSSLSGREPIYSQSCSSTAARRGRTAVSGPIFQISPIRPKQAARTKVHSTASMPFSHPSHAPSMAISFTSPPPMPGKSTKQTIISPPQASKPPTRSASSGSPTVPPAYCHSADHDAAVSVPVVDLVPQQVGRGGDQRNARSRTVARSSASPLTAGRSGRCSAGLPCPG